MNPQSATKIGVVFFRKDKMMQNVLKRKFFCIYFDEKICEICSFGPVLCFISFDMHIEKSNFLFSEVRNKSFFCRVGGGGSERYGLVSNF